VKFMLVAGALYS